MKKSLTRAFIGAFMSVALWQSGANAKALDNGQNEQNPKLQKQILDIQSAFKTRIDSLNTILKVILKAEEKNKAKSENLAISGYEHFYNKFKEKNENMDEIRKWHEKNLQDIKDSATESAKMLGLTNELQAFEANIQKISKTFLGKLKNAQKELDAQEEQESVYKEKLGWILQEFDIEYAEILSATYNAFTEKIEASDK